MSIKVTSFYLDSALHLDGNDLLLLLILADWCNDDGYCYYGIDRICKRLRREPRTVQTIIKSLEERNELLVCPGEGKKTLTGVTNRYYLLGYCHENNIGIPEKDIRKAKVNRQKQRAFGLTGLMTRKLGVQEPAPQEVQEPAPQEVQEPAPKPSVDPSIDPSVDPSVVTETNQPVSRSLIGEGGLVDLADQPQAAGDQPVGEELDPIQATADAPPVPTHPPASPSPATVADFDRSVALLTDPDVAMSRANAARFAEVHDFLWLVAQVADWWEDRRLGKADGVGALYNRIKAAWDIVGMSDAFLRSDLYKRHWIEGMVEPVLEWKFEGVIE